MNRGAYLRHLRRTSKGNRSRARSDGAMTPQRALRNGLFGILRYGAHSDFFMAQTLAQLARKIGATVIGDGSTSVSGCATIDAAGPSDLTFLANAKYLDSLQTTKAAAVVIDGKTTCPDRLV